MSAGPDLLLTFDFPPMDGGIARWMAEIAIGYPSDKLIVSTGAMPGSESADLRFFNRVDRVSVPARRLKTLQGLVQWSRRVTALIAEQGVGFILSLIHI